MSTPVTSNAAPPADGVTAMSSLPIVPVSMASLSE
jgi:hypothetical protein